MCRPEFIAIVVRYRCMGSFTYPGVACPANGLATCMASLRPVIFKCVLVKANRTVCFSVFFILMTGGFAARLYFYVWSRARCSIVSQVMVVALPAVYISITSLAVRSWGTTVTVYTLTVAIPICWFLVSPLPRVILHALLAIGNVEISGHTTSRQYSTQ